MSFKNLLLFGSVGAVIYYLFLKKTGSKTEQDAVAAGNWALAVKKRMGELFNTSPDFFRAVDSVVMGSQVTQAEVNDLRTNTGTSFLGQQIIVGNTLKGIYNWLVANPNAFAGKIAASEVGNTYTGSVISVAV